MQYAGERREMNIKFMLGNLKEEATLRPRRRWEDNIRMDLGENGW
jgi:hypothetical protein